MDEYLFSRLRSRRLERSREDAVRAYGVLHDTTLRALAAVRRRTRGRASGVKGFGPSKLERYGDGLFAVLASARAP